MNIEHWADALTTTISKLKMLGFFLWLNLIHWKHMEIKTLAVCRLEWSRTSL